MTRVCRQTIGGDGMFLVSMEMPGDESVVGWGADNEAHVHYQIECNNCQNTAAMPGGNFLWWNKFYPGPVCQLGACGNPNGDHQAEDVGGGTWVYHIVADAQ